MTAPERKPDQPLLERNYIQEQWKKNPFPPWIWLVLLTLLAALLWGFWNWYENFLKEKVEKSPFLQVTNRSFSLFLWQFPEHMRINSKMKQGYLPAFQYEDKISINVGQADQYVIAPPDLLFLYHTWNRLISSEFIPRPILVEEFKEFLAYAEEWKPAYWPDAPKPYVNLIKELPQKQNSEDLNRLDESILPLEVKQAFLGWKNYFKEGDEINHIEPAYGKMREFISGHPHYARNYWRNIVDNHYPRYLISLNDSHKQEEIIPREEIPPFLRVAYYNFVKSSEAPRDIK